MRNKMLIAIVATGMLLGAGNTRADVLYDFHANFWDGMGNYSSTFTLGVNGTTVDSISGSWDGAAIIGLDGTFQSPDQQFMPSQSFPFSTSGLSFDLAGPGREGGVYINIFYLAGPNYYGLAWNSDRTLAYSSYGINSFTVTPDGASSVPEPATLALLGAGLFALTSARRRVG